MKAPGTRANEAERVGVLHGYEVLDTEPEPSFDALTALAASVLGVPIALVSLVDTDRQWFKSRYGLDASETPRDVSFCGHVVEAEATLVVPDTNVDPRFADNPLATGRPHVRFYAGAPLRTPDGFVIGTLCVVDHVPRHLSPVQRTQLELLAGQVVEQLESRRRRREVAAGRATAVANARQLRALFHAMTEGVVVQDSQGVITTANPAAERILGLTFDQMVGRSSVDPSWRSVHEDGSPFPGETHPAMTTLRTGQPAHGVVMGVYKPAEELTWIRINALPLGAGGSAEVEGVLTTFHDITAERAARVIAERLSRQQHLVTTGTLAAGVGHEINNPLTYILANIEFAMDEVRAIAGGSASSRMKELVEVLGEARDGAIRVQKIVRGLRALARDESAPVPTALEGVVDVSLNMAAHELRNKATVHKELRATPLVLADESRLTQVLVNLLVNAAHAFNTGDVARNHVTVASSVGVDGRIVIEVRDNGVGIAKDVLERIFDPFFTTKPVGEGTGLGLAICRSIASALDGDISAESTPGKGTTMRLRLPAAKAEVDEASAAAAVPVATRGRVLVIDDEPAILAALARILARDHDVVVIADPREAWDRLERGERFDVVFCDVMMPHLSGDVLHARAAALDARLADRFVFMTGAATERKTKAFLDEVENERVEKPFNLQNVRGIVRRFVDARKVES